MHNDNEKTAVGAAACVKNVNSDARNIPQTQQNGNTQMPQFTPRKQPKVKTKKIKVSETSPDGSVKSVSEIDIPIARTSYAPADYEYFAKLVIRELHIFNAAREGKAALFWYDGRIFRRCAKTNDERIMRAIAEIEGKVYAKVQKGMPDNGDPEKYAFMRKVERVVNEFYSEEPEGINVIKNTPTKARTLSERSIKEISTLVYANASYRTMGENTARRTCFADCVVDFSTPVGEVLEHSPQMIFTSYIDIAYKQPHDTKIYEECQKHLRLWANKDVDIQLLLGEVYGYCIYNGNDMDKIIYFAEGNEDGDKDGGNNGKSTMLGALRHMLGAENCCTVAFQNLKQGSFHVSQLPGKYANIVDDMSGKTIEDNDFLKAVAKRAARGD